MLGFKLAEMATRNRDRLQAHRFEAGLAAALPSLRQLARRLERSDADGDEALQETLERAWVARHQLTSAATVHVWLREILIRAIAGSLRGELARSLDEVEQQQLLLPDVDDPAAVLERAADDKGLRKALRLLPAADRVSVVLHDGEGLSAGRVAEALGVSEEAARQRVQRARGRLIAALALGAPEPGVAEEGCRSFRLLAQELIDGRLGEEELTVVEDHLAGCAACSLALQAAVGVVEVVSGRPLATLPPDLRERLSPAADG